MTNATTTTVESEPAYVQQGAVPFTWESTRRFKAASLDAFTLKFVQDDLNRKYLLKLNTNINK